MPKLLITGATGLLGSNLIRLAGESHDVVGWAKSRTHWPHGYAFVCADLTNAELTRQQLRQLLPGVIVHCAAMTDVERCERECALARATNVDATQVLAEWSAEHDAQFVFISTDSVFDGQRGHNSEEDHPAPVNEYARTKLAAESAARACHPAALILRTNFYGRSSDEKPSLAEWMLAKLVRREPLQAFADVQFNPLLVNHLCEIILDLISRRATGLFHAAARNECSKYEFALRIAATFGFDAEKIFPALVEEHGFAAQRPRNTTLAAGKLSGFVRREMPSVEEGLHAFKRLFEVGYASLLKGIEMERSVL